jgi:hypothetical protein
MKRKLFKTKSKYDFHCFRSIPQYSGSSHETESDLEMMAAEYSSLAGLSDWDDQSETIFLLASSFSG